MRVTVRMFAGLKDAVENDRLELDLTDGATLADLWSVLESAHPAVESYRGRVAFALGDRLADSDAELDNGDEVALLPPVSGG